MFIYFLFYLFLTHAPIRVPLLYFLLCTLFLSLRYFLNTYFIRLYLVYIFIILPHAAFNILTFLF